MDVFFGISTLARVYKSTNEFIARIAGSIIHGCPIDPDGAAQTNKQDNGAAEV
jgi:hypothetical protein